MPKATLSNFSQANQLTIIESRKGRYASLFCAFCCYHEPMSYKTFNKEILRSIKDSLGRFIAITLIVALGCGFYAGLKTTAPDMNLSADNYYDQVGLMDIRVVSTLGMEDQDIETIRFLKGVESVSPAYETDIMALIGAEQYAIRVHSLLQDANMLTVAEGRLPSAKGECVLSADKVMGTPVSIGEAIYVNENSVDDSLDTDAFTVVGFVHSPYYVSSVSMGTTTLGSGSINQYMYVTDDSFSEDFPITEAFVQVYGAKDAESGSEKYQQLVDDVVDEIEGVSEECEDRRLASIKQEAQDKVDEAREKFEKEERKAEKDLSDAKSELDSGKSQIESNEKKIDSAKKEYEKGLKSYKSEKAKSEKKLAFAEKSIKQGQEKLDNAKKELDAQIAQFEAAKPYMPKPVIDATEAELGKAKATIDAQSKKLATAKKELKSGREKAKKEFSAAKKKLDSAKADIADGEKKIEDAKREYDDGLKKYEDAKREAEAELSKARKKIDDAQEEVDDLDDLKSEWLVLDRTKNLGVESFRSDAERISNIAQVFPLIFFLVAALVALTTMTRMVDEDRMIIGTLKALGYSRARITSKYLLYAFAASGIGAVIGIVILSIVLPAVIMEAYSIIYYVPHSLVMPLDPGISIFSALLGIGITLITTWFACAATLRESPAALMLPRAPHSGKVILVERIKPFWNHLSFLWKVTLRNIFRYKKRFFMTLIGIAGCTALLLTGLGLQDSINDIIDKQFGVTVKYNVTVTFDDRDAAETEGPIVSDMLDESTFVQEKSVCPVGSNDKTYYATLIVPENPQDFQELWLLRERVSQQQLNLGNGVVIDEKLASSMNLSVGDEIVIADQDDMGNASNKRVSLRVDGIMENYIADYVFMSAETYTDVYGKSPKFTTIIGVGDASESRHDELLQAIHDVPGVKTVAFNDETIDTYKTMLKSVNMVVVVLVVAAAVLAFIVLYNLTNINIAERAREIATLKVLGFTRREVYLYIFREILMLTVLGALLGLVLGIFLEGFVVVTAEVDHVMFGRDIHPMSFVLGFVLTLAFSIVVMIFMGKRLDKIDMVESLKSVE